MPQWDQRNGDVPGSSPGSRRPDPQPVGKRTRIEQLDVQRQPAHDAAPAPHASQACSALAHDAHRSSLDRALDLIHLGTAQLTAIESTLLPAYHHAVAAIDSAAVRALALQIVGGVARIVDAQAQIVQLVPHVDTGPHAAHASTAATDPFTPDPTQLAQLTVAKAELDAAVEIRVPRLAVQVSPQLFGEQLVAGALEALPHVRDVLVQLTYEAGLVVQLLEEADAIAQLVHPVDQERRTSEPASDTARAQAADRLEEWRSRPIHFLFLARVLAARGVWQSLQGARSERGHTADELARKVTAQAQETGTTADVGAAWDADEASKALTEGPPRRYAPGRRVTEDDAQHVFEMLARAEPRARAKLVQQLHRMHKLDAMCSRLPWMQVKQLWESIDDKEASALLEPYWAGQGVGKSLGKRLQEQDRWYASALDRFLDITTLGAKPRIDAAYDAREAGLISDDAYWSSVDKAIGRAAVTGVAMAATGGLPVSSRVAQPRDSGSARRQRAGSLPGP